MEICAPVGEQCDGMDDVEDYQRRVNVHFLVAAGAPEAYRDVVGYHWDGDHR